jgi:hypothetical protein
MRLLLCAAGVAGLVAGHAFGQADSRSREREPLEPPPFGPSRPDAPLPPRGPHAPGELAQPPRAGGPAAEPVQPPIDSDAERPKPNYDGKEDETSAGEVLLWVPRVLLSPLYFTSEYVVRRPLNWLGNTAEKNHWPAFLIDWFTFGPERQAGIIPSLLIDFGLRPSVGLYFFWDEFLAENNVLRAYAATGGPDFLAFRIADRLEVHEGHEIGARFALTIRPDHVFYGFGPDTPDERFRYGKTVIEGGLGYDADLWRSSRVEAFAGVRRVDIDLAETCCGNPSVAEGIASGALSVPPRFGEDYTLLRSGVIASLDTRRERDVPSALGQRRLKREQSASDFVPTGGSGIKLAARVEHSAGLTRLEARAPDEPSRMHFIRYGATVGGFIDLTDQQRVLGVQVAADFVDPLTDNSPIPFTEQVTLGGDRVLRGFLPGRLVDRSAAAARFSYTWPVWVWLDGEFVYSVGNVFDEHLDGFELELLRSSFEFGMRGIGSRDHEFEILFAVGTDTFEDGSNVENFRFVFGATSGF